MADNYLITGYHGEPHVTAENDRGINAGTFGAGRFVLPVGEQFRAEYIGNNTIRLYDGKLMNNGAAAGIPAGEFIDLLIANAGQGMNRNDLIVFQYSKDDSTGVESGTFVVVQGAEASGTATDPELTHEDLLTNTATFDQMALWRIPVSGATIAAPVQVFTKKGVYDTGEWTPVINAGTITNHKCAYMKVGNMVTVTFMIEGTGDSASATGTANYAKITGLPFKPADGARWYSGGGHAQGLNVLSGYYFTGYNIQPGDETIYVRTDNAGAGGYAYIANGGKTFYMSGCITYPIAE